MLSCVYTSKTCNVNTIWGHFSYFSLIIWYFFYFVKACAAPCSSHARKLLKDCSLPDKLIINS